MWDIFRGNSTTFYWCLDGFLLTFNYALAKVYKNGRIWIIRMHKIAIFAWLMLSCFVIFSFIWLCFVLILLFVLCFVTFALFTSFSKVFLVLFIFLYCSLRVFFFGRSSLIGTHTPHGLRCLNFCTALCLHNEDDIYSVNECGCFVCCFVYLFWLLLLLLCICMWVLSTVGEKPKTEKPIEWLFLFSFWSMW